MTTFRARDVLRTDCPTLTPQTPIRRAVAVLVDTGAAAAPVLGDDGALVGILTGKDCFRPALHASYHREWRGVVADHMTTSVFHVSLDDEIIRVAEMFLAQPHRVFPVLDDDQVLGLLYRSDVLKLLTRFG